MSLQKDVESLQKRVIALEQEVPKIYKLEERVRGLETDVRQLRSNVKLLQEAGFLQIVPVIDTKLQDAVRLFGVRGKPFRRETFYDFLGREERTGGMNLTLVDRRFFDRSFDRLVRQKFISQRHGWYRLGGM